MAGDLCLLTWDGFAKRKSNEERLVISKPGVALYQPRTAGVAVVKFRFFQRQQP
jgi:hypothetical protein